MYICEKFACFALHIYTTVCTHRRIPNYKDSDCLRNNNTFCRFFDTNDKVFMTSTDKRDIRKSVRSEIAKFSATEKEHLSAQIFSKIGQLEEVSQATTIAIFVSLPDEPQTAKFIEELSLHKRVVVPRIEGEEMNFYDISEGLSEGAFGIMEPVATTPIEPSEIDTMIVPGVAFTRDGKRLGRGKGFYDKYLSHKGFRAYTIGICYPCQLVGELPTEPHDKQLDLIVTI